MRGESRPIRPPLLPLDSLERTLSSFEPCRESCVMLLCATYFALSDAFGSVHSPGRFFAAQQLKLMLAYIALHYEIRPLEKRPSNVQVSDFSFPPLEATLEVRRRRDGEI